MLDVRRLRVLREVARQGSFSAAADELAFTQPAISRQIAQLEAEAGATLVERTPRGVRLTQAGALLVGHADAILARLQAAERQLAGLASLDGGLLRLGAFPTANATLVPKALIAFAGEHPGVELQLVEALSAPELVPMLHRGELDLAVVADIGDDLDVPEDVCLTHLMDDPLFVALPRGHHLAEHAGLTFVDLRDETWIEGRARPGMLPLLSAARAAGFEPRIGFESTQWLGKQGLVAAGLGITLIPRIALATVRDDVVLRTVEGGPVRQIWIAKADRGYEPPAAEPMAAALRRVAEEHCFACDALVV